MNKVSISQVQTVKSVRRIRVRKKRTKRVQHEIDLRTPSGRRTLPY